MYKDKKTVEEEKKAKELLESDGLTGPSIWFEQSKKKIEKLSGSFAFTDNDHNVQDKINEIIDHLNNQNK